MLFVALTTLALLPTVAGHGALALNQFDTYALSDFEGHEDSFPWEGFEIWDIYAGDGYSTYLESHGVYFKGNFAGDGTLRPTGGQSWDLTFSFTVGNTSYERTISHDGSTVTTDFEQLEHQLADGNVFQVHAWVPIPTWENLTIQDLVVLSAVDGSPRDIAPGGFYDPITGQEIPFSAPPTPVFPAMGEGRIVETVPLTGAAKFLDTTVVQSENQFTFHVNNTLAEQGQHFTVHIHNNSAWALNGNPSVESIEGGQGTTFNLQLAPANDGSIAPLQIDLRTDIGGLQSWYAYTNGEVIKMTNVAAEAQTYEAGDQQQDTPALGIPLLVCAIGLIGFRARKES